MKLLSLEKSVKGAIKIVTELKLPNLAERFNNILEVSHSGSSLYIISLNAFLISHGFLSLSGYRKDY